METSLLVRRLPCRARSSLPPGPAIAYRARRLAGIPWRDCPNDAERLDVHNGLLLSALWDAAFDRGLVSFDDAGLLKFSPQLSEAACAELRWKAPIQLTDKHKGRLAWHRAHNFMDGSS
jgi:HNH endonuclease